MSGVLESVVAFLETWWVELLCGLVIVAVVPLIAGYVVLVERKLMADMQARLGPMRVGPHGLLQPVADAFKLLIKEDIIPDDADKAIFWIAPVMVVTTAMVSMGALSIGPVFQVARDINVGLLFVIGVSALGLFGIVLGGWASNSHYSLLGALRSTAQLLSYETAAGLALVSGLVLAGTLKIHAIVDAQQQAHVWFVFLTPVAFLIYLVASIAETNRAPFDLTEAESELVAGYMTEFSGFRWSLYFLGEYANMIVVASVATTLFLGGWLRPFPNVGWLNWLDAVPAGITAAAGMYCLFRAGRQPTRAQVWVMWAVAAACLGGAGVLAAPLLPALGFLKAGIHGAFWFLLKVSAYLYMFMWLRFTLPRYRFDQLMHLGWYFLIPLAIVNVFAVGLAVILISEFGWNRWLALAVTMAFTLGSALLLMIEGERHAAAANVASAGARDSYAR